MESKFKKRTMTKTLTSTTSKPEKKKKKYNPKEWGDVNPDEAEAAMAGDPDIKTDAKTRYRPPSTNITFVAHWENFIENVVARKNFNQGHLAHLEILCKLYVELEKLEGIVERKGYTYRVESRQGAQIKTRPEVVQLNHTRQDILRYSKMLGLMLVKDQQMKKDDEAKDEWS